MSEINEAIESRDKQNRELQAELDEIYSCSPCPKCGIGVVSFCLGCKIKELQAENKQLKHALGHANAALADFGDDSIGDMRLKLEDMKIENDRLKKAIITFVDWCEPDCKEVQDAVDRLKQALKGGE